MLKDVETISDFVIKPVVARRSTVLSEQVFHSNASFFRKHFIVTQLTSLIETFFGLLSEGVFVLDSQLNYVSVSEQFLQMTGLPRDEILGKTFCFHPIDFYPEYHRKIFLKIQQQLTQFESVNELLSFENRNGKSILGHVRIVPVKFDNFFVYIGTVVSVNRQHEIRFDIEELLRYDTLTHLPNLSRFVDSLQIAIKAGQTLKDPNRQLAVIRLNIDKLQSFNESIGIAATDELLQLFVKRIDALTPPSQCRVKCFSRFGGDNFGILLEIDALAAAYAYLDKLSQLFEMPFFIESIPPLYVRVSVGVSLHPRDSSSAESMITQAESALKQARLYGGDDIVWYEKTHRNSLFQDTHLSSAFNKALNDAEIVPFFQPKLVFAQPNQPMFEALVRWQHPILGTLTPQDFLDDVIDGMSQRLFERIIHLCVRQLVAWKRLGYFVTVCINVDARQFNNERFLNFIFELLNKYPCFAKHIELELTEIARLVDKPKAITVLQQLVDCGISLAIDDFGTGYSSLSYLAEYPVNLVKIDRVFIQDILTNPKKQTLVKSIIHLAHDLNISVIAEGVETEAQKAFLQAIGCDGIQGYVYGKPMSAPQATAWLEQHFEKDTALADDFLKRFPDGVLSYQVNQQSNETPANHPSHNPLDR